jgi:hypothetical protein
MKSFLAVVCFSLLFPAISLSANLEALIRNGQKASAPVFPEVNCGDFRILCKSALEGNINDQRRLVDFQLRYIESVYNPLKPTGGLLVSSRKLEKGYDTASGNYAVNLNAFFEETSDEVQVRKKNFEVQTRAGVSYPVAFPRYHPADDSIEVKDGGGSKWIPLAELTDRDGRFVRNALADEVFESSSGFDISISDTRLNDISRDEQRGHVDHIHDETGERVSGSYVTSSMDEVLRTVVLENRGSFPLENLVVEYQSFAEQTVMRLPKDTPTDYRCVGCIEVEHLAPGERKEIELNLPAVVNAKMESITTGDYIYSVAIPPEQNPKSEGRMNGIWVKVHRFTPYGERLTRECKSSGVPSRDWECVVPAGAVSR